MRMRELIYHKHYWSIPHNRDSDNRIIQICYDCGKERESPIRLGSSGPEPSSGRSQARRRTLDAGDQTEVKPATG
jgi:hypothetical protein